MKRTSRNIGIYAVILLLVLSMAWMYTRTPQDEVKTINFSTMVDHLADKEVKELIVDNNTMMMTATLDGGGKVRCVYTLVDYSIISEKYLQQIVKSMVDAGLLAGASGKGGGYKLLRKPSEYPIGEVLELTEGTLAPVACLAPDAEPCDRRDSCKTLPMWQKIDEMTHDYLASITVADLIDGTAAFPE